MFEKQELIAIREKAKDEANIEGLNPDWQRTYFALADAANHLEAMMARTIDKKN